MSIRQRTGLLVSFLVLLCFARSGVCQEQPHERTWVDSTGKYRVTATFVTVEGDRVRLRKQDGSIIDVPLQRLSEADRQLATTLAKQAERKSANGTDNPFGGPDKKPAKEKTLTRAELIQQVQRSIVYISTRDNLGAPQGLGSGFVVDSNGLVATNYHVIQQASSATARFRDGTEVEVAGYRALDKEHDLAILQLKQPPADLHALRFDPDRRMEQGDAVMAFGHPAGFEFTVSDGIVSAVRRTAEMPQGVRELLRSAPDCIWIQISVPLVPGSSGGPLLDMSGNLLGVNSWLIQGQSIAFAVHAQHLASLMEKLPESVEPFPVPGSFQGPGVSDAEVLARLSTFRLDFPEFLQKTASVQDPKARLQIINTENPAPKCIAALRTLAAERKGTQTAFEALISIARLVQISQNVSLQLAGESTARRYRKPLKAALEQIVEAHADEPSLAMFSLELCGLATEEVHDFQRAIISRTNRDDVRGLTTLALGIALSNNPRTMGRAEEEATACLERDVDEVGKVKIGQEMLESIARPILMNWKHRSIGRFAADISGIDSRGQEFQLSDYAGEVILLDFWVDWCPYCRQMYPHERELLKKYADRPLKVLGVNSDKFERLKSVEESGTVTWRSWADGVGGPIARAWEVESYPTIYLLDHQGRIRLKGNLRGDLLTRYIEPLVKEKELGFRFDVIAPCSVWNYLETGEAPRETWREPDFDDSQWNSGRGPFGYGLGGEGTLAGYGEGGHTTYFRKRFIVADSAALDNLVLGVSFDDGVAVHLNGVEVFRENLSPEAKPGDAAVKEAKGNGITPKYVSLESGLLKTGENIFAVELHQHNPESKDLRFDLTLSSGVELPPSTVAISESGDSDAVEK